MADTFYSRDFSESVFWGVNLQRARFRDADLSGTSFFHVFMKNVSIDGEIDRLVINGVDVTDFVNQHDRWWPLRNNLSPDSVEGIRQSWEILSAEWATLLAKVSVVDASIVHQSVNGEWSLNETLRHLIFAMDKWFTLPILGEQNFNPIGLPNTESKDRRWPGLAVAQGVDLVSVLSERALQHTRFSSFISSLQLAELPETVEIEENGQVPALMCFHVVLEEEFEHLRYMIRDLSALGVR